MLLNYSKFMYLVEINFWIYCVIEGMRFTINLLVYSLFSRLQRGSFVLFLRAFRNHKSCYMIMYKWTLNRVFLQGMRVTCLVFARKKKQFNTHVDSIQVLIGAKFGGILKSRNHNHYRKNQQLVYIFLCSSALLLNFISSAGIFI